MVLDVLGEILWTLSLIPESFLYCCLQWKAHGGGGQCGECWLLSIHSVVGYLGTLIPHTRPHGVIWRWAFSSIPSFMIVPSSSEPVIKHPWVSRLLRTASPIQKFSSFMILCVFCPLMKYLLVIIRSVAQSSAAFYKLDKKVQSDLLK